MSAQSCSRFRRPTSGSITGAIDDGWQTAIEDVGPAGVDKGKGGKYLILPPGYKEKVPDGYIALRSQTYGATRCCGRSSRAAAMPTSPRPSPTASGSSSIRSRQAANPPATTLRRRHRRAVRRHHSLRHALLRVARPHRADRAVARARQGDDRSRSRRSASRRASRSSPTRRHRTVAQGRRTRSARVARPQVRRRAFPPSLKAPLGVARLAGTRRRHRRPYFADPDSYPSRRRAASPISCAFFSAKHLGAGQFYLMTYQGQGWPRASTARRPIASRVPPNAPVKQYWSATAYDRDTHALIRDMPWSSRSSRRRDCKERRRFGGCLLRPQSARRARNRTGFRRSRTDGSKFCSACTARRSRCSTRPGCCRTSRQFRSFSRRGPPAPRVAGRAAAACSAPDRCWVECPSRRAAADPSRSA